MSDAPLHLAHPERWPVLLAWLGLVAVLILLERRGSDSLDRLVARALQERLVDRPSRWRRWARIALLAASGLALALALLQPQWGLRHIATPRVGAEIMLALDVSRSMLADDAKPTRLERAKAEIRDLLGYLDDDHVGLIAFAGNASVLSPMTPDKSFLRLALDGAGPHSVSRGGTRLAEPILRAVAGFGDPGPAQRALILITDGEDHDSFALDAAKRAAEAGIKIIAIGFGDEAGSPVYVRDPRTGARTRLEDADGEPVISRLDGDLLRELALATDGAFVPAGTGVLDLASIYDAHIRRLTRGQLDERGRTIRDEIYQLPLVVAFVCLVAAVWVMAGRARDFGAGSVALVVTFGAGLALHGAAPAQAQAVDSPSVAPAAAPDLAPDTEGAAAAGKPERPEREESPRVRFNRANQRLAAGDHTAASVLYRDARRDATDDPELRYAATYNLGLAATARADARAGESPEEALAALYEAADWFREAASARPEAEPPRRNLDVVLRRALALADEIAHAEDGAIEAELDRLVDDQRARVAGTAGLLEAVVRAGEIEAAERLRPAFRDAATEQRLLLAHADELAERIATERDTLDQTPEDARTPEDALRASQLAGALVYLEAAVDRMGQTRRQLRQRRAERAYRRASAALGELKRARDQLRDPVEQIGVLIAEVAGLAGGTQRLAAEPLAADAGAPAAASSASASAGPAPRLPAFLSAESLEEESRRLENRVRELGVRFEQAAIDAESAAGSAAPPPGPAAGGEPPGAPSEAERAALREAITRTAPLVARAAEEMESATGAIGREAFVEALAREAETARLLSEAQEQFFDLRQLLSAAHRDATRIAALTTGSESPADDAAGEEGGRADDGDPRARRDEYAPLLRELATANELRLPRLGSLLERERDQTLAALASEAAAVEGGESPTASDPVADARARFDLAEDLLEQAAFSMQETIAALATDASDVDWDRAASASVQTRDRLDAIRTLFFTLVEHLRRLAQDQVDLGDATQDALALSVAESTEAEPAARGPETRARTAALAVDQARLETRAGALADALLAQSQAAPDGPNGATPSAQAPGTGADPEAARSDGPVAGEAAEEADPAGTSAPSDPTARLRLAADHVATAQLEMGTAGAGLADPDRPLAPLREAQTRAVASLAAALELLAPPPPPEQDETGSEEQQDEAGGEAGDEDESAEPESAEDRNAGGGATESAEAPEPDPMSDPSQLLQGVRDREAERRRERERDGQRRRSQPVDKDW